MVKSSGAVWQKPAIDPTAALGSTIRLFSSRRVYHVARKGTPLRRINQNVPRDLYDRLAETALREDRTKSAVLVRALEAYVDASEQAARELRRSRSVGELKRENSRRSHKVLLKTPVGSRPSEGIEEDKSREDR
jgi:hypothetical protein